jgi:PEGA domain/Tetratricopeptide repeat
MKANGRALLFTFALLVLPCPAVAGDSDAAREHFERGVALLDDSQFAGAVAELERSLAIRETPPVLYNLGLAYRGVGKYKAAIQYFNRFLEIRDEKKHEKMARLVETLLAELDAALVRLELRVSGGASVVRVDGKEVARGDGAHMLVLDPGAHTIETERTGHFTTRTSVSLKAGERKQVVLDASSRPKPSKVTIDATPIDAEIWLDGELVGRGRYRAVVDVGTHKVRIVSSGYEAADRSVRVTPGSQQRLSIVLTEESRPLTGQWWFWAGSAAVVGATVLAIIVAQPEDESPREGSLGFVTEAIRR